MGKDSEKDCGSHKHRTPSLHASLRHEHNVITTSQLTATHTALVALQIVKTKTARGYCDVPSTRVPSTPVPSSSVFEDDGSVARKLGPARSSNFAVGFGGSGISARKALRTKHISVSRVIFRTNGFLVAEMRSLTSLDETEELAVRVELADHLGEVCEWW